MNIIKQEPRHISPSPINVACIHLTRDAHKIITHTWIKRGLLLTGAQAPPGLQMLF